MRNNPTYIQLRKVAFDGGYTITQVENATAQQIANILNLDLATIPTRVKILLPAMKRVLINELRERDEDMIMQNLKSQALTWLNNNFPDSEMSRGKESGKRYVTIWLDGKPEGI